MGFPCHVDFGIKMGFQTLSRFLGLFLFLSIHQQHMVQGFPQQGKWTLTLNESQIYNGVAKNLYKGTRIFIRVNCRNPSTTAATNADLQDSGKIQIGWILRETQVT